MQENIGSFGGDSTEVTVFGESAGSASIAYHLLSPLAKGLFKVTLLCGLFPRKITLQLLTQFHTACHPSKQLSVGIRLEAPHTRARQTICKVEQYLAKSSNILDLLIIVCSQPALAAKRMRISSPACRFSVL